MSMTAGSVSVAAGEVVSGTGLARALYDADAATLTLPTAPTLGATAAPYSTERPVTALDVTLANDGRLRALQEAARRATAYATALVTYMQANAQAKVEAGAAGDGLQTTPDPNNPATATTRPAVDKFLAIV